MKHGFKIKLARKVGISGAFVGQIIKGKNRPHYKTAKKLAEVTNTDPILWLEGTPEEIKHALSNPQETA